MTNPSESGPSASPRTSRSRSWWVIGLGIAALVVIILAPLASADPDGLESVAESQGWLENARDWVFDLLPGYTIPGLDGNLSTIVAGLIGVGVVFLLVVGLGRLLARRRA